MGGIAAITWPEMEAWSRLTGTPLKPIDTRLLNAIDASYRTAVSKAIELARPKGGTK